MTEEPAAAGPPEKGKIGKNVFSYVQYRYGMFLPSIL
jgi:hypothetical protein